MDNEIYANVREYTINNVLYRNINDILRYDKTHINKTIYLFKVPESLCPLCNKYNFKLEEHENKVYCLNCNHIYYSKINIEPLISK